MKGICPNCGHMGLFRGPCPGCNAYAKAEKLERAKVSVRLSRNDVKTAPIGVNGMEADFWRGCVRLRRNGVTYMVIQGDEIRALAEAYKRFSKARRQ